MAAPYHRKIKAWRDPMPKAPDYLSPHCASQNCAWCTERRSRAKARAVALEQAAAAPSMFSDIWDMKVGGHQEQLGPSSPEWWIKTGVKKEGGPGDVLGYWPPKPYGAP